MLMYYQKTDYLIKHFFYLLVVVDKQIYSLQ